MSSLCDLYASSVENNTNTVTSMQSRFVVLSQFERTTVSKSKCHGWVEMDFNVMASRIHPFLSLSRTWTDTPVYVCPARSICVQEQPVKYALMRSQTPPPMLSPSMLQDFCREAANTSVTKFSGVYRITKNARPIVCIWAGRRLRTVQSIVVSLYDRTCDGY